MSCRIVILLCCERKARWWARENWYYRSSIKPISDLSNVPLVCTIQCNSEMLNSGKFLINISLLHSGLACVNFVFQIHTTQKVFWPLKIIIQIVFKWFWMIVPNFNYFEAIFVFLTNCCCHLPYESEDLKPPKACPRLLRAVKWSKRKSCILIKFIILDHKKAGLGRPS